MVGAPLYPVMLSRPSREDSGHGTFVTTVTDVGVIYGTLSIHRAVLRFVCAALEDVRPEDLLTIGEPAAPSAARYRVIEVVYLPGGETRCAVCERLARPIYPTREEQP